jgi:hypothetical protein
MEWDEQKVLVNIRKADTDDLLDRITAFRAGMEPEAVEMVETELERRGVLDVDIAAHWESCQRECLFYADGTAMTCSFCRKPAVKRKWGWHKLWKRVFLFPLRLRYCKDHCQ